MRERPAGRSFVMPGLGEPSIPARFAAEPRMEGVHIEMEDRQR